MALAVSGIVSFSKTPLRMGLVAGGVVAALALLAAVLAVAAYFASAPVPSGWTTLAVLVALLSAVQLLTIGLIGIYVGAIFDEVKGRPTYVVREHLVSDSE